MKIALICTEKLPVPPVAGGAVQLYIDGIAPYLARKHDITIFSIQYPGLPDKEIVNSIKFVRLPGGDAESYLNSLKKALDSSFDLIHVFNRPRNVVELMKELPKSRFSLSLHNEMFHPEKISDEESLQCIKRIEFINTVSKYIADTVKIRFPQAADKLRVVYSGADPAVFKPSWSPEGHRDRIALREMYKLKNNKVILFVGRFSPKKGVHVLLDAVRKVMLRVPDTALVVIGSKWYGTNELDDYTKELRAKAGRLPGPVIFTGFLPPDQVCRHYSMADVFVCASQWNEPLARVHYEAMAAGLPIVTTDRGGNAEVVRGFGNGIVIDDYSNPDRMAESILYLLENPSKCLEMGRMGRRLAERFFNWKRVADEVFPESFDQQQAAGMPGKPVSAPLADIAQKVLAEKSPDEIIEAALDAESANNETSVGHFSAAAKAKYSGEATESVDGSKSSAGDLMMDEDIKFSVGNFITAAEDNYFTEITKSVDAKSSVENSATAENIKPSKENSSATTKDDAAGPHTAEGSTDTASPPAAPNPDRSRFGWKRNVRLLPDYRRD